MFDTGRVRWYVLLFCISFLTAHFVAAQTAKEDRDQARRRDEWFAHSRRLHGRLPASLRIKALGQVKRMRADEKARFQQRFGSLTPTQGTTITSASPGDFSLAATQAQWTAIGPAPASFGSTKMSGRITAIAIDPTNTSVIYAGAADGGVWKSTNAGVSWTPLTDQQNSLSTGSITLDPSNPSVVYVGTGEANGNGDAVYGAGVLRSTDAGASWQDIPSPFVLSSGGAVQLGGMAVDPANSSIVLAAGSVRTGAATGAGIYRSTDGGTTWTQVTTTNSFSIKFLPNDPSVVLAAGFDDSADKQAIFRSTDAGATWTEVMAVSVDFGFGVLTAGGSLAVAPGHNTIYAALGGDAVTDLFKSTDEGATWTAINNKNSSGRTLCAAQCFYNDVIAVHPTNPNLVFFGGQDLYRSTNGGSTWQFANTPHSDYHALQFTPDGGTLFAGNDGGVWSTAAPTASSISWTDLNAGLATLQFYPGISVFPGNPQLGLGGTQDNGTMKYTGTTQWSEVLGADGLQTALHPSNTSLFYTTTEDGNVWETTNGGSNFTLQTNGLNLFNANFFTVVTMDPHNAARLYTAPSNVYRSDNGSSSWTQILSTSSLCGSVNNIAVAPSNANIVYISDGSCLTVSGNATTSSPTFTVHQSPGRTVTWVAISAADATVAYATLGGFSAGDGKGHVYKVSSSGATWANISGNLPDVPVNDIVLDPDVPNTLYIATDAGVFSTSDGGSTWNSMVSNMPQSAVMGLALDRSTRTLRAATHGRSAFDLQLPSVAQVCAPPTSSGVNICTPAAGSTAASPVRITAAATSTNPIISMEVWIDGVKKTAVVGRQVDFTIALAAGGHTVSVFGVDSTGIKVNKKISFTVSGSTTCAPPSTAGVNICSPAAGSTVTSPVLVSAAAKGTNPIVSMEVWIDGVKKTSVSGNTVTYSATLAAGSHTVNVFGIDSTGAKVNKKISFTVGGSTTCSPPSSAGVNICSPLAGSTVKSPVQVSAAAKGTNPIVRMEVWIDGVKKTSVSGNTVTYSATLAAGGHTLNVFGIDSTGAKVNKKITFTVSP